MDYLQVVQDFVRTPGGSIFNRRQHDWDYINRCLTEAHNISIERAILDNVRKRKDWQWAAIVWGLFKARTRQSYKILPSIQAGLTKCDRSFEDGLEPYINFLVAGRHLRQNESSLEYQHPRVELGLETAMREKPELSSRSLSYLVKSLISIDTFTRDDWGREAAAHLLRGVSNQKQLKLDLGSHIQAQIDEWINDRLIMTGPDFEDELKLAAAIGSTKSLPSELARWLTGSLVKNKGWFFNWEPNPATDEWYETVSKHPATKPICEAFIRRILPSNNRFYPTAFAKHICRLIHNPAPAFRDAALSIVKYGAISNDEPIAFGALLDIDGFEPVVHAAVTYLIKCREEDKKDGLWLAIANEEYSEEEANYHAESKGEQGYTADSFLRVYVNAVRKEKGWASLCNHPHATYFIGPWLRLMLEQIADQNEWAFVAKLSIDTDDEAYFWREVTNCWKPIFLPHLKKRLIEGGEENRRIAATSVLVRNLNSEVRGIVENIVKNHDIYRILELASDLNFVLVKEGYVLEDKYLMDVLEHAIISSSPPLIATIIPALFCSREMQTLPQASLTFLSAINIQKNSRLKLAQVHILHKHGIAVDALIEELILANENDTDSEIEVISSVIEIAIELGYRSIVENALQHRFASVRERALVALANLSAGPLSESLLALAIDKSTRVRKALLAQIKKSFYKEHFSTLILLAQDTWSPSIQYYDDNDVDYPIAVEAAKYCKEWPHILDEYCDVFIEIAKNCSDTFVGRNLLSALVIKGSETSKRKVLDLALKTGSPPLHKIAANALTDALVHIEPKLASSISVTHILQGPPAIACELSIILGACADPSYVLSSAHKIAVDHRRKGLVFLLVVATHFREDDLMQKIISFIPESLGRALLNFIDNDTKISFDLIDDIGDVQIVEMIKARIPFVFESGNSPAGLSRPK